MTAFSKRQFAAVIFSSWMLISCAENTVAKKASVADLITAEVVELAESGITDKQGNKLPYNRSSMHGSFMLIELANNLNYPRSMKSIKVINNADEYDAFVSREFELINKMPPNPFGDIFGYNNENIKPVVSSESHMSLIQEKDLKSNISSIIDFNEVTLLALPSIQTTCCRSFDFDVVVKHKIRQIQVKVTTTQCMHPGAVRFLSSYNRRWMIIPKLASGYGAALEYDWVNPMLE